MEIDTTENQVRSWMYAGPKSRLIRYGQWLVIPLLLFIGLEKGFKNWIAARESGYLSAMSFPPPSHVDAIFLGVSRVEAAIDPSVFDTRVSQALGHPFVSLNLGAPNRSIAMHYLGVRNLFEKYPEKFKGCTLFLEAPFGLPERNTWNDSWYIPAGKKNLISVLRSEDLPRALAAEQKSSDKLAMIELWAESHSRVVFYRNLLRWRLLEKYESGLTSAIRKAHLLHETSDTGLDIYTNGMIRTDAEAFSVGHAQAVQWVADELATQKPVEDWNATVLGDLNRLAVQNGGKLVLFEMPQHTIFAPPSQTPLRREDARKLENTLSQWHTGMLHPAFSYNDNDFPDWWHMRRTLRAEYTTQLAEAWLKSLPASSSPPQK